MDSESALFPAPRVDAGLALLRIVVGIVFLAHGAQKLFGMGFSGTSDLFTHLGIPAPGLTGPLIALIEFFGGLALIGGLLTQLAASGLAADMLGAILMVHLKNGFYVPQGIEFVVTLFAANVMFVLTGPGAISLDSVLRRMSAPPGHFAK